MIEKIGLECILDLVRALRMGSCLSCDSGSSAPPSPSSSRSPSKRIRRSGRRRAREEQLLQVSGRTVVNGTSSVASLFSQQGKKGVNQDAMIVWENFGSQTDTVFCGVFDGHGPYGHLVAKRVRDSLPQMLCAHWEANIGSEDCRENSFSTAGSMDSEEIATIGLDEEPQASTDAVGKEKCPDIYTTLKESFLKAFKVMDKELKSHPNIDCFFSGTTAVTLVKKGQDLVIGNVGDSRAVLGTKNQDGSLMAVQLTVDLKPNVPREAERIKKCKGRVFALHDEPEVARVWLPNYDSPGLAMARAFGDFCLKGFGLISVPEISYRCLTEWDEFVVLATDGIWDVMSNKEVVDIVASAPARSSAARLVVESAVRAWRLKYPTSKVDDCAVVCLFLDSDVLDVYSIPKTKAQDCSSGVTEPGESKQELSSPPSLERFRTAQSCSNCTIKEDKEALKPMAHSDHRHSSGNAPESDEDEWSALEGVSRVNTLVTLPRFVSGEN